MNAEALIEKLQPIADANHGVPPADQASRIIREHADAQSEQMVERVARALCAHHDLRPDEEVFGHARWHGWVRQAEAALAAMTPSLQVMFETPSGLNTSGEHAQTVNTNDLHSGSLPKSIGRSS